MPYAPEAVKWITFMKFGLSCLERERERGTVNSLIPTAKYLVMCYIKSGNYTLKNGWQSKRGGIFYVGRNNMAGNFQEVFFLPVKWNLPITVTVMQKMNNNYLFV